VALGSELEKIRPCHRCVQRGFWSHIAGSCDSVQERVQGTSHVLRVLPKCRVVPKFCEGLRGCLGAPSGCDYSRMCP
jgi:hypothetical protein